MDPYQILGISPNASDDEVKHAYRTLSKKYHPDANINSVHQAEYTEKFKQVQNAYKTITNMWCAEIAVSRLTRLIECILKGDDPETLYHDSGPCSPADVIPQDDMYREITSGSRSK